jgi:hypothetical protein
MERGEVDSICGISTASRSGGRWIPDKTMRSVQGGAKLTELAGVPFVRDLARNDGNGRRSTFSMTRALGDVSSRRLDLPADRLKMLRDAFVATMKDRVCAEASKSKQVDPDGRTSQPDRENLRDAQTDRG